MGPSAMGCERESEGGKRNFSSRASESLRCRGGAGAASEGGEGDAEVGGEGYTFVGGRNCRCGRADDFERDAYS